MKGKLENICIYSASLSNWLFDESLHGKIINILEMFVLEKTICFIEFPSGVKKSEISRFYNINVMEIREPKFKYFLSETFYNPSLDILNCLFDYFVTGNILIINTNGEYWERLPVDYIGHFYYNDLGNKYLNAEYIHVNKNMEMIEWVGFNASNKPKIDSILTMTDKQAYKKNIEDLSIIKNKKKWFKF